MGAGRAAWIWAALAGVLVTAGSALDGRTSGAPHALAAPPLAGAAPAVAAPSCPAWALVAGRGEVAGGSVALFTDGVALLMPCPGTPVIVRLTGTRARGVGAWAALETLEGVVFADHVGPDGVEVRVDGSAWLAFTNDLYAGGEDRNLRATAR